MAKILLVLVTAWFLVWSFLLNPDRGLVSRVLGWVGIEPITWLGNADLAMWGIVMTTVWWSVGFNLVLFLAGLQDIDPHLYEAAKLDGATPWQVFRYMTFPHLRQYLELAGLLGAIYVVQNFDAVFTITSGGLGTANLPFTIYQIFYNAHDYGRASAAGVVVVIGTIIIATFALRTVSTLFKEESS